MSARVLVTGPSGFIGRPLINALAARGFVVRAATRNAAAGDFPSGVEVVGVGDYRRPIDWAGVLAGVDAVVHLAGIAHTGGADAEAYDRVNRAATAELVAACAKAGVKRFVFMSSVRAQCGPAADRVLTEEDAPHPSDPYGRSKLQAEAAVRAGAVEWVILRPVLVYGPGVKGNLATLLRVADTPVPLPVPSLKSRRSLVSVDNLIAAVDLALSSPEMARQTFLVADPAPLSVMQILAALRAGLGRPRRLIPVPGRAIEMALKAIGRGEIWEKLGGSLVVDPGRLIAAGWGPDVDTEGGLERMAAASRRAP